MPKTELRLRRYKQSKIARKLGFRGREVNRCPDPDLDRHASRGGAGDTVAAGGARRRSRWRRGGRRGGGERPGWRRGRPVAAPGGGGRGPRAGEGGGGRRRCGRRRGAPVTRAAAGGASGGGGLGRRRRRRRIGPRGPALGLGPASVAAANWSRGDTWRRRVGWRRRADVVRSDPDTSVGGGVDLFFLTRVSDGGRRDPNGGGINRHKWS